MNNIKKFKVYLIGQSIFLTVFVGGLFTLISNKILLSFVFGLFITILYAICVYGMFIDIVRKLGD